MLDGTRSQVILVGLIGRLSNPDFQALLGRLTAPILGAGDEKLGWGDRLSHQSLVRSSARTA